MEWEIDSKPIWWDATLLPHDGRTSDSVAIRVLKYQSLPHLGFPDESQEDVIFVGQETLIQYESQEALTYRVLSEDGSPLQWLSAAQVESLVQTILSNALSNTQFSQLPMNRQMELADQIKAKKEKLIMLLQQQHSIVTKEHVLSLLQNAVEDEEDS